MSDEEALVVVIDNGSDTCKAGFESEEAPNCAFPSIVGYPKRRGYYMAYEEEEAYLG